MDVAVPTRLHPNEKLEISTEDEYADIDAIARYIGEKLDNQNQLYQDLYIDAEKRKGTKIFRAPNFHY